MVVVDDVGPEAAPCCLVWSLPCGAASFLPQAISSNATHTIASRRARRDKFRSVNILPPRISLTNGLRIVSEKSGYHSQPRNPLVVGRLVGNRGATAAQKAVKIVSFIFPGHLRQTQSASRCSLCLATPHESAPSCAEMFHSWRRERTTLQIGALMARVTETVKERTFHFAENAGVLSKVIDEHDVAVYIANL